MNSTVKTEGASIVIVGSPAKPILTMAATWTAKVVRNFFASKGSPLDERPNVEYIRVMTMETI